MKKSLLVAACIAAASFAANASSVSLYGNLDTGFAYQHLKVKGDFQLEDVGPIQNVKFNKKNNRFVMRDGITSANFIGLKGREDLGNGMQVGFVLESQFHLINGDFQKHLNIKAEDWNDVVGQRLFEREARLFVNGAFGEISAGRMGTLTSPSGSFNIISKTGDPFEGHASSYQYDAKLNNALTYKSPEFAGITAYAQYALDAFDLQEDKYKDNIRYYAFGATFNHENINLAGAIEQLRMPKDHEESNPLAFHLAANINLGDLTLYSTAGYAKFNNADSYFDGEIDEKIKGNAKHVSLGAKYAFGNSEVMGAVKFINSKYDSVKCNAQGVAARYDYHLSNRTSLYAGTAYAHGKIKAIDTKIDAFTAYAGLKHSF